jgi:hypothetical protein
MKLMADMNLVNTSHHLTEQIQYYLKKQRVNKKVMYTAYPYVIKNDSGAYLQKNATILNPIWGNIGTAMHIRHYIGAITIQEVTGGWVFQLNRDCYEYNFVSL